MDSRQQKYAAVIAALLDGQTVVTASRRLARELLLHFADHNLARIPVWERPAVLPWPAWLQQLWQKIVWGGSRPSDLRLLGQGQFELAWEQLIYKSEGDSLLQTGAAARQAARAWALAHEWRMPWQAARELASEDAARFLDWADDYRKICGEAGWIERARLADIVVEFLDGESRDLAPESIVLAGFDELTPQQQALVDALERAGTRINRWLPAHPSCEIRKRKIVDAEAELAAAASWCLDSLNDDPACTIGVVVPDLSERYEEVTRVFSDVLAPATCEDLTESGEQVFSVSAGPPLARHPMIAAALAIIETADAIPAWTRTSQLLRSRFLGDALQEADARAALDVVLRKEGGTRWPLADLAGRIRIALDEKSVEACPALLARFEKALELRAAWPQRQDTHGWVQAISDWLETFGWPGERTLDSNEYQLLMRWRELLEEIAAYESMLGDTAISAVLRLLQRLSADARFKPESGRCPVEVLGVLEAAGLEFDKLWVCGLHDGVWPPAPSPTPFLPYALQRSQGMPHSTAARELDVAGVQLRRLVHSAPEAVLSWPATNGDEELRPSPLIEAFPDATDAADLEKGMDRRAAELFNSRPTMDRVADTRAPVLSPSHSTKGGASVLALQASCPFRAFAELRLSAKRLEQPAPGLDAINRGSIAHDSLFEVWRELGDQETLARLNAQARSDLVRRSVDKVLHAEKADSDPLLTNLLELESRRLARLIEKLLEVELARPAFKVEMLEERKIATVGPLRLSTRLDRLDILGDGSRLVIDYKTGSALPGHWFGSRPRAPQLPLYASSLGLQNVRGLAFVRISSVAVQYAGVCDAADEMPPGVRPLTRTQSAQQDVKDWQELLDDWRDRLAGLATDYYQGTARVDPLADACRTCHLHSMCRVDELRSIGELSGDV